MDARNGIGGSLSGLDLRAEIDRLRKERNAVILAHYYQKPELQDLADFVGDSLDLSRRAAETDAEVIAFCGVRFMAETAKILSPDKIVVLPDMNAGCSLEDSCPPEQFAAFRAAHPDHIALTYINCSTEVKALSDIIVTSSSAEKILAQIPESQKIIFGPDRNLGGYLKRKVGRDLLLWPGVCIVHEAFSETELLKLKAQHPGAPVAAHPECPPHVLDHADYVGSTRGILEFSQTVPGDTLIVATEPHIIHQMEKAMPGKTFIGAPGADGNCNCNICPYMALNTMEKLYLALRDLTPRIEIEEGLRLQAKKSLDRMLEMAAGTVGQGDLGAIGGASPKRGGAGSPPRRLDAHLRRIIVHILREPRLRGRVRAGAVRQVVPPDDQVAGTRGDAHGPVAEIHRSRIGVAQRGQPFDQAMVEAGNQLERALVRSGVGEIEDALRREGDRRDEAHVPVQPRCGEAARRAQRRVEAHPVDARPQVARAPELGKGLVHPRCASRRLQCGMLEKLDHQPVGARPMPACRIGRIGPGRFPEQGRRRFDFPGRDRAAQDHIALRIPMGEVRRIEHRRHRVDPRELGGDLRRRRGAGDRGMIAGDGHWVGPARGGDDPAPEGLEIGLFAAQKL